MSEGSGIPDPILHFGGPDLPPRLLRDLLRARIDAVPPGGEIAWSTYYFRDRDLAQALADASKRGVQVTLHVEGRPRRATVNRAVLALLQDQGLAGGLHVHAPLPGPLRKLHGHLHSKIYYFSHPRPHVLVGSFNPSGDIPEDPDVIAEIGDQDRGHNLLAEFAEPYLVTALRSHILSLSRPLLRCWPSQNRAVRGCQANLWFYPRLRPGIIDGALAGLGRGTLIEGAISHLKHGSLTAHLIRAANAGAVVRLIVHDTERRVPEQTIHTLAQAGIEVTRYVHPEGLPLHAKFLLIDDQGQQTAYFGSFNYNPRSRYLNNELLVASGHAGLYRTLAGRFAEIAAEMRG